MHISAKDKNTGKENKITIKSNSGLSDDEVQRMIREAEENADADKKARTLIETRNSAEAQMHEVKKDLEEFRSELSETEIAELETVIKAVEEAAKGDDAEKITEELNKVYPAMKSLLDKKQAKEQAAQQPAQPETPAEDNVVDATFTETEKKAD
jgi:molecular chaperone DnaK